MKQSETRPFFSHGMAKWGLFMMLLFALWFGGWFVAANYADGKVRDAVKQAAANGLEVNCREQDIRGFPFRLGIHCMGVDVVDNQGELTLQLGTVRTAAQLYAPGKMIGEFDAPLKLVRDGQSVGANWSRMRAFVDADFEGGFELASLSFSELDVSVDGQKLFIGEGALHSRPANSAATGNGPSSGEQPAGGSLDIAIDLKKIRSAQKVANRLPELDLYLDAQLEQGYRDLIEAGLPLQALLEDGASGNVRSLSVSVPGGGKLVISGRLHLAANGLLSGEIDVGMAKADVVARAFSGADPVLRDVVVNLGNALNMMGKKARSDEDGLRSVPIKLQNGDVRLGFIKIAKIPPLRLN